MKAANSIGEADERGDVIHPNTGDAPECPPELKRLFDFALALSGERLDAKRELQGFIAELHEGAEGPFRIADLPSGRVDHTLTRVHGIPCDASVRAYATASEGWFEHEGLAGRAIILEGAERFSPRTQRWAVPFEFNFDTGTPVPLGLHFIDGRSSRFVATPTVARSIGATLKGITLQPSVSAHGYASRYPHRIERMIRDIFGTDARGCVGHSMAELLPSLKSVGTPPTMLRTIAKVIDIMRSAANDTPLTAAFGRNLAPRSDSVPSFFPDLLVVCAAPDLIVAPHSEEPRFAIDPLNFLVTPRADLAQSPLPSLRSTVRLEVAGLTAGELLFVPPIPPVAGARRFRWFVGLYRELVAATAYRTLAHWVRVEAGFLGPADEKNGDPLFKSSLKCNETFAAIDTGLFNVVLNGSRVVAEAAAVRLLSPYAQSLELISDGASVERGTLYPEHFLSFEDLPGIARYGATLETVGQVAEELFAYLGSSGGR